MSTEQASLSPQEIYGGFWIRLGAGLIDILVATPIVGPMMWMDNLSETSYISLFGLNVALSLFLCSYCVKKWGATPGKMALGLKIVMENGDNVDQAAVWLRPSVIYVHSLVSLAVKWFSMQQIPDNVFEASSHLERMKLLSAVYPKLSFQVLLFGNLWLLESLFLLANEKKRAIHDYMAGTVVINRQYQALLKDRDSDLAD